MDTSSFQPHWITALHSPLYPICWMGFMCNFASAWQRTLAGIQTGIRPRHGSIQNIWLLHTVNKINTNSTKLYNSSNNIIFYIEGGVFLRFSAPGDGECCLREVHAVGWPGDVVGEVGGVQRGEGGRVQHQEVGLLLLSIVTNRDQDPVILCHTI